MKCTIDGAEWRIEFAHSLAGSGRHRRRITSCTVSRPSENSADWIPAFSSVTRLSTKRRIPPVLIDLEQAGDFLESEAAVLSSQFGLSEQFKKSVSHMLEESQVVQQCAAELIRSLAKRDSDSRKLACTIALGKAIPDKALRRKFLRAWNNRPRDVNQTKSRTQGEST